MAPLPLCSRLNTKIYTVQDVAIQEYINRALICHESQGIYSNSSIAGPLQRRWEFHDWQTSSSSDDWAHGWNWAPAQSWTGNWEVGQLFRTLFIVFMGMIGGFIFIAIVFWGCGLLDERRLKRIAKASAARREENNNKAHKLIWKPIEADIQPNETQDPEKQETSKDANVERVSVRSRQEIQVRSYSSESSRIWDEEDLEPASVPLPPSIYSRMSYDPWRGSRIMTYDGLGRIDASEVSNTARPNSEFGIPSQNADLIGMYEDLVDIPDHTVRSKAGRMSAAF